MNKRYEGWGTKRRYAHAIKKVLEDGWTISEAARELGINRSHLSVRVKEEREKRKAEEEAAAREVAEGRYAPRVEERRRVGTFEEFFQTYFTNWRCPDCEIHHELPDFHHEIIDAIESPARRVLINLPPYHSKSTLVTVWHTVYDIVRNPNSRTIIVSKSAPFAKAFLHAIKQLLADPNLYADSQRNLIEDWGPFMPESGGWSEYEVYVQGRTTAEKDPTVLAMGYGTQIYGRRADRIKFDDIATLDNQRNPEQVEKMLEWINKEALSRIGKRGQAIWVGTRVAPGDIYYHLAQRPGYVVIRYSALLDEATQQVLWPEHFPYEQVLIHRGEMSPADFQLVYQNVDVPGLNASFTAEMMDAAKDETRGLGHFEYGWRLIAGLDPAGAHKDSGVTALTLWGVDLNTGKRYLVDIHAEKSMKAPRLRDWVLQWSEVYPIYEWRVESNGVQSQLVQYNEEIIKPLAQKGIRVVPHITSGKNKWDAEFGVDSLAPLFHANLVSLPWLGHDTQRAVQPLIDEFIAFPMGITSDRVMSSWFAELGIREVLRRAHLPMFNERLRSRWPARIRKRAMVADFERGEVRPISWEEQRLGNLARGQRNYRRLVVGRPVPHHQVEELPPPEEEGPVNVDPRIWNPALR